MRNLKFILFWLFLFASSLVAREVTVSWNANSATDLVTEYRVYRVDNGLKTLLASPISTSATISAETGWSVAVSAFNGLESVLSDSVLVPVGPPPPTIYTIVSVSNQETVTSDKQVAFAFDGDPSTYWQTSSTGIYPYEIIVDFGKQFRVGGINYNAAILQGTIGKFEIYVSNDMSNWGVAAGNGEFANTLDLKTFTMAKKLGRYAKLKILTSSSIGTNYCNIAELTYILTEQPSQPAKPTGLKVEFVK